MRMITLCAFLLLVLMGDALGGMEGVVSWAQPTETPLHMAWVPNPPGMATTWNRAAPTENETAPSGVATAAPEGPAGFWSASTGTDGVDTYIVLFLIFWVIIGFWSCYNRITPLLRTYPVRSRLATKRTKLVTRRASRPSVSDGDDVPFLSSDQDRPQKML